MYLEVKPTGTRSWLFRYSRFGRAREMGLGPTHTISLAEARNKALFCRKQLLDGIDPIDARRAARAALVQSRIQAPSFRRCAAAYIEANKIGWRSAKHAEQWTSTLEMYVHPVFGDQPVDKVDTAKVMEAIEPIWGTKPETATRVRGRVEAILDWAKVRGYRSGDNPARWRGHLDQLLPRRSKVAAVRHHPALPFSEMPAFMKALRKEEGMGARALELIILTSTRTTESIAARWPEFDLQAESWTIPPERMKASREHRVPLSRPALRLLRDLEKLANGSENVFPGLDQDKPLSNMACLKVLERMGRTEITVHGFRSTFRDWAAETTNFPREVVEAALAHTISDKVEAAYRRGDLFQKRRELMSAWSTYCYSSAGKDRPAKSRT